METCFRGRYQRCHEGYLEEDGVDMKRLLFKVEIYVDESLSWKDCREYINDAVCSWGGAYHPDDPLFGIEQEQVNVVRTTKKSL